MGSFPQTGVLSPMSTRGLGIKELARVEKEAVFFPKPADRAVFLCSP